MPVFYNTSGIIPAPFVGFQKVFNTTEDGTIVGSTWQIVVKGKLALNKGSPNSLGSFHRGFGYPADETLDSTQLIKCFQGKQEALRKLFANYNEGKLFSVQSYDGSAPITCNPRIRTPIEFSDGPWLTTCDYTINLEADRLYSSGVLVGEDTGDVLNYHVKKAQEDWNIEAADENQRTFRLTHSLSAQGSRYYDNTGTLVQEAWQNAKDYVLNKLALGFDTTKMEASGVLNLNGFNAYNYVRAQKIDELGGVFAVTETWLCASGTSVEEFDVNSRTSNTDGLTYVTINGNIRGMEQRNNTTYALIKSKYDNAVTYWNGISASLETRAENFSGTSMNSVPVQAAVGRNQFTGIITYNYEYNNRANPNIAGALSEVIVENYKNPTDIFAAIPVLGRPAGPILQAIGSSGVHEKSVDIEIVMSPSTQAGAASQPQTNSLVTSLKPSAATIFVAQDDISWSANTGRYSRRVSWVYEP